MSKYIKRATITVDQLAQQYFVPSGQPTRRQVDILAELQEHLQAKGDDPRYSRVIFAVENQKDFVETDEGHAELAGVFPRFLHVRYNYGTENRGLRNVMGTNIRDTLVVADTEAVAKLWESELKTLEYQVRRI